jgi:hypothetical protein
MIRRCAKHQDGLPFEASDVTIAWLWLIDAPADPLIWRRLRGAQRALISVKLG